MGQEVGVRGVRGEVHLDEDGGEEGRQAVADCGLDDGEGLVAVRLLGHDDVGGDGRGQAGADEHADEEGGVHEARVAGAGGDEAEADGGGHEEGLELDEEVGAPFGGVGEKDRGRERAAGDEEDEGGGEVGHDEFFFGFLGGGDLDLRGDDDDERDAEEEPLVLEEPEEEAGVAAGDGRWRWRVEFDFFLHGCEGMVIGLLGVHGRVKTRRHCVIAGQELNLRKTLNKRSSSN